MASKVFADANLLLDFSLKRVGFEDAAAIFRLAVEGSILLYTTPAVLHIIAYYTAQAYGNKDSRKLVSVLLNDLQIIDCDHATAVIAVNSGIDDIEDALQYYTAIAHGVDYFLSSDKKLKNTAIPQLPVYKPSEFLKEFKNIGG